ncbi:MAG: hydratase [Spirochaetaceae bacterium]|jgi:aconitate hydratase|nr:hydratase [Spirochaetaceae bacterium]
MVTLHRSGVLYHEGALVPADGGNPSGADREKTIAYQILAAHNAGDSRNLRLTFDSLTSHDITYVGIVQTARASGMKAFPVPYVLTNCHNSLCAVGGTINEDDHRFALSAAVKYGGIFVPPHLAVIHSYNREMMAGCGKMILGSDSHTRYGALGTMAVGEGGGELAKQLLSRTYDTAYPEVVAVELAGAPRNGVGPHDVALAIIKEVFDSGFVKNKVMEFVGPGIASLSQDFRNGIDVMTTETACWSSIWETDETVKDWLAAVGRPDDFRELHPEEGAYYDGGITVDLSRIEPSIALPFHPSKVYTIEEFKANAADMLAEVDKEAEKRFGKPGAALGLRGKARDGSVFVDQAVIAGCSGGTPGNLAAVAAILRQSTEGNGATAQNNAAKPLVNGFSLSVYPDSQVVNNLIVKNGVAAALLDAGAVLHSAFCGPCFGAGDTPANGALSIRHTTRNFPNREGSKPGEGQCAAVALMDARSIAATALNGGKLTSAFEIDFAEPDASFQVSRKGRLPFDTSVYRKRVFSGWGKPEPSTPLVFGPNIKDWPAIPVLPEHLVIKVASFITDDVTTTDELIPSGETSSFRSNPLRLAEFTLSRRDPAYVQKAKDVLNLGDADKAALIERARTLPGCGGIDETNAGVLIDVQSGIYARKPGDGSAREQAASCQRVLGGGANFALEYATKRYRSNLINWGLLPFLVERESDLAPDTFIFVPHLRKAVAEQGETGAADIIRAYRLTDGREITLRLGALTATERDILLAGCLINYYKSGDEG